MRSPTPDLAALIALADLKPLDDPRKFVDQSVTKCVDLLDRVVRIVVRRVEGGEVQGVNAGGGGWGEEVNEGLEVGYDD